jgi:hypothetical protein
LVPLAAACPHLGVGQALDFGTLDRLGLGQDALALIALARLAPAHNHGSEPAGLLRAPGQRPITRTQEDEMPEVGAVQRLGSPDYLVLARRQRIIKMRDSYRQLAEE